MAKLVRYIDSFGDSSASSFGKWLVGLPLGALIYASGMIYDAIDVDDYNEKRLRLFCKSKKQH